LSPIGFFFFNPKFHIPLEKGVNQQKKQENAHFISTLPRYGLFVNSNHQFSKFGKFELQQLYCLHAIFLLLLRLPWEQNWSFSWKLLSFESEIKQFRYFYWQRPPHFMTRNLTGTNKDLQPYAKEIGWKRSNGSRIVNIFSRRWKF
jgi:hypothetical protein